MRDRRRGRSREWKRTSTSEMHGELGPLTVEQDAAQVKNVFGSPSAPSHSRAIKSHADQVANGAFSSAGGDVEIVTAEHVVVHAMAMRAEVLEDLEQLLALAFVAGTRLGDGGIRRRQRRDHLVS